MKALRVFDFDETLVRTDCKIKVKEPSGIEFELTPAEYALYSAVDGVEFDFSDFNKAKFDADPINENISILKKMLDQPHKKVTVLTARRLAYPVKNFLDSMGIDVYIVALGTSDPQAKKDWIEDHIKKGYDDIAFMDDSIKNIKAVSELITEYPNVIFTLKYIQFE